MARKAPSKPKTGYPGTATIDFGAKLWLTAGQLRNNMDSAEPERNGGSQPQATRSSSEARQYKHVVLGLIFLSRAEPNRSRACVTQRTSRGLRVKYIADSFDIKRAKRLANGSMSSNQSGVGDIHRALIKADSVDTSLRDSAFPRSKAIHQVMSESKDNTIAHPDQLFYSTHIYSCLWFLAKNKTADAKRWFRDRCKQTLLIAARKLGTLIDRVQSELTDADRLEITNSCSSRDTK
jgi:hypothetical protein